MQSVKRASEIEFELQSGSPQYVDGMTELNRQDIWDDN